MPLVSSHMRFACLLAFRQEQLQVLLPMQSAHVRSTKGNLQWLNKMQTMIQHHRIGKNLHYRSIMAYGLPTFIPYPCTTASVSFCGPVNPSGWHGSIL